MKCTNCGMVYDDGCRFCGACGTKLISDKKGTHRVPILIMLFLTVLGLWVFFAAGGAAPSRPAGLSGDSWLAVDDGMLYADPGVFDIYTELEIPEVIDGQTVTGISSHCFAEFRSVTVVDLPDTVESIGVSAFEGCDSLRAMDLPPALTSIGTDAFAGCGSLEAIHIPASVNYIGWNAFEGCDSLSFIFYDGTINEWSALYTQKLGPETEICCTDGNYFQSE